MPNDFKDAQRLTGLLWFEAGAESAKALVLHPRDKRVSQQAWHLFCYATICWAVE
jgi:hypothetical protein